MTTNNKTLQNFNEVYQRLNKEQLLAVNTTEGPVMVNAGPGTGKTQILSTRVGNILLKTDTNPNNILCLTYTDNGAVEMRNRLLKIIDTAAYGVKIHTFHSFCNEVIQDNISYFGKLNLEPISELEEIDLFNKLIDSIDSDNILKRFRGDVYYETSRLKALFALMKKEAFSVEYINNKADEFLEEIRNSEKDTPYYKKYKYQKKFKDKEAGDLKQDFYKLEESLGVLKAAAALYPRYNEMMKEISRYNFDDMILWVLNAFEKNKNLLLDYQERFLYILVDEFQDTSRSQNLLLQYLINYWDVPNVFVVGDADQSIYSFQGANVENIVEFEKKYKENITVINLINNYRSTQIILNAAHRLIKKNIGRTQKNDEPLISSLPSLQNISIKPEIVEYPNLTHEAMNIALQLETLVNKGVSGKEIAVIYRNHAQVEEIVTILESKNIAVNSRKKIDVLQLPFIQNIITILTWIDKENTISYSADDLLFKILHFNFFDAKPADIALLNMQVNEKNIGRKENRYSLRRMLNEIQPSNGDLFSQPNNSLQQISSVLENLLKQANNITVQHLVELVVQKANVLSYIMQSPEKPWLMQVLNSFFNYIKDTCKRNPETTLHELLNGIHLMQKNKIAIPLYKVVATDNGINLITAHASKGSEFTYVFVIGCTDKIWDENNASKNRAYKYPDNLIGDETKNEHNSLEESRRLFYVAVTRAKTHLHISYSVKDKNEKDLIKSTFVTEICKEMNWQPVQKIVPDEQLVDYLALQFKETAQPEIELVEENYINQILKNYSLSVTHLNNYLDCPLKFYYQNLIKVPSAKSESMVFGSAVHFALQRLFEKMKENNQTFASADDLLNDFNWYMQKNREAFTPESFVLKMDYGKKILPPYYNEHIDKWNKIVVVEKNIRNVAVSNVPLNGKLDKLEFTGKQVTVIDYKTGKFDNAKKKLNSPDAIKAQKARDENKPNNAKEYENGGDYWRQAVFYTILIDNDKSNDWQALSTVFEFVEPENKEYLTQKVVVTPNDINIVTAQIKDTWQKIQAKEFHTGCGKPECEWCSFVKTNELTINRNTDDADDTD
ncbi:MAG: ATP-dependent helicase [Chitinophagaceae bacterium]|nr:ATP-dependent helicase [Chitinophagaceae bacterium]MCW5904179.1 ATP-dependent helicase [Chitinophagaceae bacterium]